MSKKQYNSVFISDIHLGSTASQTEKVTSFLKSVTTKKLFLVGDIVDGLRLQSKFHWPESHNNFIRQLLDMQKKGVVIYYVPGNHDAFAREWINEATEQTIIHIDNEFIYQGLDGNKYLVLHGDMFDGFHSFSKILWIIGDKAYTFAFFLNTWYNKIRSLLGLDYWSLSAYLKRNVKHAVNFISEFETNLANYAETKGCDGVICGHIHTAEIKQINGIFYLNSGDWVESCTALVENKDGTWQILTMK